MQKHFVHNQSVNAGKEHDVEVSDIAAAIGEPARARILYCLSDGRARTSTELAMVAGVTPSTASVHLNTLKSRRLVTVFAQGKHRYYSLEGEDVADALESLSVLAGGGRAGFVPNTPHELRAARTCYDHIAGTLGVALHDRMTALRWISPVKKSDLLSYVLTPSGAKSLAALGIDVEAAANSRRRFAYPCVDWSERRPHLGGAIGAELLATALKKRWIAQDSYSRALEVTRSGRREFNARFGLAAY
ncbi:MAG: helix-turn-helix transcriptional regulator [Candidatus Acidiferrales bacterium]